MTESSSTTKSIPACRECEYSYNLTGDDDFPIFACKFHYFEEPNYITGVINKVSLYCDDAREREKYCGHEGKNFKQRQIVVEEKKESSLMKGLKGIVKTFLYS